VKVYFVNSTTDFYVDGNDYAFTNDNDWDRYYWRPVQNLQVLEACFQILDSNPITIKGTPHIVAKKAEDIDYIVNLSKYIVVTRFELMVV
jgi:hypothetical protein